MFAERFRAKKKAEGPVTDLDAVMESPGSVRLHGKEHQIKPVLVGEFFAFANAMAGVEALRAEPKVTVEQIVDAYYGIIYPIIPTIEKDDIRKCTPSQVSGLLSLVNLHVTGKLTDEKKKSLKLDPSSLLKQ